MKVRAEAWWPVIPAIRLQVRISASPRATRWKTADGIGVRRDGPEQKTGANDGSQNSAGTGDHSAANRNLISGVAPAL